MKHDLSVRTLQWCFSFDVGEAVGVRQDSLGLRWSVKRDVRWGSGMIVVRTERQEKQKIKNDTNEPSKSLKINRRYFGTQYVFENELFIGFNPVYY
jgi:hypothetical protein